MSSGGNGVAGLKPRSRRTRDGDSNPIRSTRPRPLPGRDPHRGHARRPGQRLARAALRGRPPGVGGDRGGRQLHAPGAGPWHRTAPHRPDRRRLRASAPARRRPPVGAAERGGHGQGPVERVPGRGAAPAVRPGPRTRLADRRHLRAARRAVRHLHARTQYRAVRGRHAAVRVPGRARALQAGRGQERTRTARSAALALLLPGRGGTRRRLPRLHRLGRAWRQRDPARRTGRHRAHRERAASGRSPSGVRQFTAGGARLALGGDQGRRSAVGGHARGPPRLPEHRRIPCREGLA